MLDFVEELDVRVEEVDEVGRVQLGGSVLPPPHAIVREVVVVEPVAVVTAFPG